MAVSKGGVLVAGIAVLFYNTLLAVFPLTPVLLFYLWNWKQQCCQEKEKVFRQQFKESMTALSASLRVGYSVENALKETAKDLRLLYPPDTRICKEFQYMMHQLEMHFTAEEILTGFARRVNLEEAESFVTVFLTAKRSGGDSVAIIRDTVKIICDKLEVSREIETLMAAKRMEFKVMTAIPFAMMLYMRTSFAEFMSVLYGNPLGIGIMTGCLVIYGGAWYMGRRIVHIEI